MISLKALAAAVLLAATAATPAFAQGALVSSSGQACISKIYATPGIIRGTTSIRTGP